MDVAELARRLFVSRTYVVKLLERGDLPCTRDANGRRIIDDAEAEAYIAAARERQARAMEEYMRMSQEQKR